MKAEAIYNDEEFLDAEKEMAEIAHRASQKYKIESNAMFAKLREVAKALSGRTPARGRNPGRVMQSGFSCCAAELAEFGENHFTFSSDPEQCDVMVVAGWIAKSAAPRIRSLYERMSEPRHVIAYGECAASGGPWWQSYSIMQGIDEVLPVDVYVVGCPPKPKNLFAAMMKLQDKVGGKVAGNPERSVSENIRREKAGRV
jgi:NADH-quinone oxidoreductase subunit B